MKIRSAKNKGKRLQNWTASKIAEITGLKVEKDGDIESRQMGMSGVDVILRGKAKELFPFSVENKNVETLNLFAAIGQAKNNIMAGTNWLLICKKNREDPVVIIDAEIFFKLYKKIIEYETCTCMIDSEEFYKKVEEGLKHPISLTPTPKINNIRK